MRNIYFCVSPHVSLNGIIEVHVKESQNDAFLLIYEAEIEDSKFQKVYILPKSFKSHLRKIEDDFKYLDTRFHGKRYYEPIKLLEKWWRCRQVDREKYKGQSLSRAVKNILTNTVEYETWDINKSDENDRLVLERRKLNQFFRLLFSNFALTRSNILSNTRKLKNQSTIEFQKSLINDILVYVCRCLKCDMPIFITADVYKSLFPYHMCLLE